MKDFIQLGLAHPGGYVDGVDDVNDDISTVAPGGPLFFFSSK